MEDRITYIADELDKIRFSFHRAKVNKRDSYLLAINYNIPRRLVTSLASTHKALTHLHWCLTQDLMLDLPLPFSKGSYAVSCNTLLRQRHTGELRIFRQSFNAQAGGYNMLADFTGLVGQSAMATHVFSLCEDEDVLHDTVNLPIGEDSDWGLIGVLSVVVNVQVWVKGRQLNRIGLLDKKMKHFTVPPHNGMPEESHPIGYMDQ